MNVGYLLVEYRHMFPESVQRNIEQLSDISRWLRKAREFAFHGEVDFIPSLEYTKEDAEKAIQDVHFVIESARECIPLPEA